ncbi:MAG: hypothetical protein IJW40_09470 [Clostridia bacterium]|nr:hypothetical protein [Clostridia bacterium]
MDQILRFSCFLRSKRDKPLIFAPNGSAAKAASTTQNFDAGWIQTIGAACAFASDICAIARIQAYHWTVNS